MKDNKLILYFAVVVILSFFGYHLKSHIDAGWQGEVKSQLTNEEKRFPVQTDFITNSIMAHNSKLAGAVDGKKLSDEYEESLEYGLKGLEEYRFKSAKASLLYAIVDRELGRKTNPKDLEAIKKDKSRLFLDANLIYGDTELNLIDAYKISSSTKHPGFKNIMKVHAYEKAGDQTKRAEVYGDKLLWQIVGMFAFFVAPLATLIFLISYFIRRKKGQLKPQGLPIEISDQNSANQFTIWYGLLILLFGCFTYLLLNKTGFKDIYAEVIAGTIALFLGMIFLRFKVGEERISLKRLMGSRQNISSIIKSGFWFAAVGLTFSFVFGIISLKFFGTTAIAESNPMSWSSLDLAQAHPWTLFVVMVLVGPFLEEIFFRGTLLPILAKKLNSVWLGAIVSSIAFAVFHSYSLVLLFAMFGTGLILSFAAYQTKSLWPAYIAHALGNFVVFSTMMEKSF